MTPPRQDDLSISVEKRAKQGQQTNRRGKTGDISKIQDVFHKVLINSVYCGTICCGIAFVVVIMLTFCSSVFSPFRTAPLPLGALLFFGQSKSRGTLHDWGILRPLRLFRVKSYIFASVVIAVLFELYLMILRPFSNPFHIIAEIILCYFYPKWFKVFVRIQISLTHFFYNHYSVFPVTVCADR